MSRETVETVLMSVAVVIFGLMFGGVLGTLILEIALN